MADTTIGRAFSLWLADGSHFYGTTLASWDMLPDTDIVLVDVIEPKDYAPGKPYRWRMECEWFGCRPLGSGLLEFQRWHDAASPPPAGDEWHWKRGVLIPDAAMAEIRRQAD